MRFASLAAVRTSLPVLCEVAAALQPGTKELLGQGIDVSTRPGTPLSHALVTPSSLKLCTRPGEMGDPALKPLWAPPILLSSLSVPYCRIHASGEGLVNRVLAPSEGLLSP